MCSLRFRVSSDGTLTVNRYLYSLPSDVHRTNLPYRKLPLASRFKCSSREDAVKWFFSPHSTGLWHLTYPVERKHNNLRPGTFLDFGGRYSRSNIKFKQGHKIHTGWMETDRISLRVLRDKNGLLKSGKHARKRKRGQTAAEERKAK